MTVSGTGSKAEWLSYSTAIGLSRNTMRKYLRSGEFGTRESAGAAERA
ncbi:hypothetical protein NKI56_34925 [Mesorhizobium sp. M0622]